MANTDNNTIALQISSTSGYYEAAALSTIVPGMLLGRSNNRTVRPHQNNAGPAENMYAMEAAYQGKGISDSYATNERVYTRICRPGDVVLAWVSHTAPILEGQFLMSLGGTGGYLTVVSAAEVGGVLAVLLEEYLDEPTPTRKMIQIV